MISPGIEGSFRLEAELTDEIPPESQREACGSPFNKVNPSFLMLTKLSAMAVRSV